MAATSSRKSSQAKVSAHRQSLAVTRSHQASEDQSFIDAVSDLRSTKASNEARGHLDRFRWQQLSGKTRPVVIVQDDSFDPTTSITVGAFTTDKTDAPFIGLLIEPDGHNGLRLANRLIVDKISSGSIGHLDRADSDSTGEIDAWRRHDDPRSPFAPKSLTVPGRHALLKKLVNR